MDKNELLERIETSRRELDALLSEFAPGQMEQPVLPGGWTLKDFLAHLEFWERRAVARYQALREGQAGRLPGDDLSEDEINRQAYEHSRARSLDEVRAAERAAYGALLAVVRAAPDADLFDPQRFSFTGGQPLWGWFKGPTYGHYEEHLPDLRAALPPRTAGQRVLLAAKDFLAAHGRDIDRARFAYHFEGAITRDELLAVLAGYQNPDGGFTRLEVDIQAPVSNPFATELALVVMRWAGTPPDHPLLARTAAHLEAAQHPAGGWRFAPEVYEHGLAPWFQHWTWPNLNPACTIAGLLRQLGAGSEQLHERVQALFDRLSNPRELTGGEFYEARPYAYYFQSEWTYPLADLYRWGVAWWLVRQHYANPGLDATHFIEYAPMPASAVARRLPAVPLTEQLDRLLAEQQPDGGWPTPYSPAWRPWITVNNLLSLRAYRRI